MSDASPRREVAVTGAAGSLGRRVVAALLERDDVARVVALDRAALDTTDPRLAFHACDVRDPGIARHLEGCDAVVHLAFIVERGSRDPAETEAINVGGTQNVFLKAAAVGVEQFVYASSIAAYGFRADTDGVFLGEDAPIRGNDEFYYARHKARVEHWLDEFEREHPAVRVARLRPSVFLGEGSARPTAALRSPLHFYLPGAATRAQVTHEVDVAAAFLLALEKRARGAFNVATADALSGREMGAAMGKWALPLPRGALRLYRAAWRAKLVHVDPIWLEVAGGHSLLGSAEKIRKELGWTPRFPTTGDVLRRVAGRPNARASHTTRAFFGPLARITRLFGALPSRPEARAEARGLTGCVDLVFTGERPSHWHFRLRDGRLGVHAGGAEAPRTTITMRDETFRDMLSGRLAATTAQMTGRIRVRGDGEMGLLMGGLVEQFKNLRLAPGARGWPARRYAAWVMKGSDGGRLGIQESTR